MRNRGFEKVEKFKDVEFNLPKRSTKYSAGYDFESPVDVELLPGETKLITTGVKAYMKEDEVLELYSRSSNGKRGLIMPHSVGIVDCDYYNNQDNEGEIKFLFKNISNDVFKIKKGDRIGQGIFKKFLTIDNEEEITEKRKGGYGSTNKKGITLIALGITIIVLTIILSTVIFLTVYNLEQSKINNYLSEVHTLQNAILEEINLAKSEGREIRHEFLVKPLTKNEVENLKTQGYLSSDGEKFHLLTKNELEKLNVKNIDTNQQFVVNWETAEVLNLNVAKFKETIIKIEPVLTLKQEINIGDIVYYNPKEGVIDESKLTYTSLKGSSIAADDASNVSGNGNSSQTFTATENDNKWVVLYNDNGQIVLMSDDLKKTTSNESFYLSGVTGYLYSEQELHNICSIYGHGKGAAPMAEFIKKPKIGGVYENIIPQSPDFLYSGARSITLYDLQKITGIKTIKQKKESTILDFELMDETLLYYDEFINYFMVEPAQYPAVDCRIPQLASPENLMGKTVYTWWSINKEDPNIPTKLKEHIFKDTYWLASRYVYPAQSTNASYFYTNNINVDNCRALSQCGGTTTGYNIYYDRSSYVRPVVYIDKNVNIFKSNRTGYDWEVDQT